MPVLDFVCPGCGTVQRDVYRPLYTLPEPRRVHGYVVRQDFDRPVCCDAPMVVIPPHVVMDTPGAGRFQAFTTEVLQPDGSHKTVTIDSLRTLRQVERESEQRARNGEGQQMVWRDYSQDRGNTHTHTLAADPTPTLSPEAKHRFGSTLRKSVEEPVAALGPGVDDSNTSALVAAGA